MNNLVEALQKILPAVQPEVVAELAHSLEELIKVEIQRQLSQAAKAENEIWLNAEQG